MASGGQPRVSLRCAVRCGRAASTPRRDTLSVSYTHLDVYKRQALARTVATKQAMTRRLAADVTVAASALEAELGSACLLYTSRCV